MIISITISSWVVQNWILNDSKDKILQKILWGMVILVFGIK